MGKRDCTRFGPVLCVAFVGTQCQRERADDQQTFAGVAGLHLVPYEFKLSQKRSLLCQAPLAK